ncbi:ArnT family glycosyltransferase [Streptomyces sp. NPDC091265]|uniref:glycosyltransferase family 39 protein n=1 Tax=unclassified Streptomyces TaxID=2593676 RepID=UPI00344B98BE
MTTTVPDTAAGERGIGDRPHRPPTARPAWLRRLVRGHAEDPAWARPALLALLAATAALYLVGLGASGWGNQFYAAAVQAGTENWEAFLFGSSDSANFITVDKPPAALWVMGAAARIFGVDPWSVLAPQALVGVATVAVLYATVRRRFSAGAGLIAGAVLALTPVAALAFRFNNPDALLALLLTLAGYAVLRAQEDARTRWLMLAGACMGFAFLTKSLQAFLILPALGVTYLAFAPTGVWRRIRQLLLALLTMVICGGWWVALVELTPARHRPYIGGSQHNSFVELAFAYNGVGRLNGSEPGSVGQPGLASWGGAAGLVRLFRPEFGGGIAWLLPAALLLLVAGVWLTIRAPRVDPARAAFVLWGLGLLTTFLTFSEMKGIFHPYYDVALAPYIAAVVGMGTALLWNRLRSRERAAGIAPAVTLLATAVCSYVLLNRTPDWFPWLRYAVAVTGVVAALSLLVGARIPARATLAFGALGLVSALAGPTAYTLATAGQPHTGSLPGAGPAVTSTLGGGMAGADSSLITLLNGSDPGPRITALLEQNASDYTWVAAAIGSQNSAGYQLATGEPVMTIGGFNRTDRVPTPAQFEQYAGSGKIHYYIGGNIGARDLPSTRIDAWVAEHYPAHTVDGVVIYDLSGAKK